MTHSAPVRRLAATLLTAFTLALLALTVTACDRKPKAVVVKTTYVYGDEGADGAERAAPAPAAAAAGSAAAMALALEGSPWKGAADPKVTIIEVSDFQCPYCSKLAPTMDAMVEKYPDDVRLVFKHNPLSFHKRAMPAAKASMAAHLQGKFFEYHDLLFSAKQFDDGTLERYATQLGLDLAKWRADKDSPAVEAKILHDQKSATSLGARGTPASFVNGKYVKGAKPLAGMMAEVDAALAAADAELAKGTPRSGVHAAMAEQNNGIAFVNSIIKGQEPVGGPPPKAAGNSRPKEDPNKQWDVPVDPSDPYMGGKNAKVEVVVFSDFQCPFCRKVVPTLAEIKSTYGKKVKVVFMQQPLSFHSKARPAALASLAAHQQGKFWEMHDMLFENNKALDPPDFERYAKDLGLNMKKFKKAMTDPKLDAQVTRNQAVAKKVGATGTPSSYVNGYKIRGARPFPAFKEIIDRELAKLEKK